MKFSLALLFVSSIFLHGTTSSFGLAGGIIICEDLTKESCSFAISSSGKRCVLENYEDKKGRVAYQCRTSEVMVEDQETIMKSGGGYLETQECVKACGVNRNATGISSDTLLDKRSVVTLCSPQCYHKCPNIVDLHSNLAIGEGVSLADLCQKLQHNNDPDCNNMIELLSSSGVVADGPVASNDKHRLFSAAAPSPFSF